MSNWNLKVYDFIKGEKILVACANGLNDDLERYWWNYYHAEGHALIESQNMDIVEEQMILDRHLADSDGYACDQIMM